MPYAAPKAKLNLKTVTGTNVIFHRQSGLKTRAYGRSNANICGAAGLRTAFLPCGH